jgi:hypothetical protein
MRVSGAYNGILIMTIAPYALHGTRTTNQTWPGRVSEALTTELATVGTINIDIQQPGKRLGMLQVNPHLLAAQRILGADQQAIVTGAIATVHNRLRLQRFFKLVAGPLQQRRTTGGCFIRAGQIGGQLDHRGMAGLNKLLHFPVTLLSGVEQITL